MLLLPLPFLFKRGFALGYVCLIAIRIDKRIRTTGLHLLVFGFQAEVGSMRSQKKIARQPLQHSERLHVILCNLRVVLISDENVSGIYVRATDDHGIQGSAALLNLHRPGRAALRVARREVRCQLGASQFHRVTIV